MKISADDLLDIMAVASNRIHRELKNAYTTGHLKEYLQKIDMADLYPEEKRVNCKCKLNTDIIKKHYQ